MYVDIRGIQNLICTVVQIETERKKKLQLYVKKKVTEKALLISVLYAIPIYIYTLHTKKR